MIKGTLLLVILLGSISLGGQLGRIIEEAMKHNPMFASYEHKKKALEYRRKFSLSLPNPSVRLSLNNFATNYPYPTAKNPMSSVGIYLSQKYVLPVKRILQSQIEDSKKRLVESNREVFKKELIRDIKLAYYDFQFSYVYEDILRKIHEEVKALLRTAKDRYVYGKVLLSDLILLRSELIRVEEELQRAFRLRETALARMKSLVGKSINVEPEGLELLKFPEHFKPERNVRVKSLLSQIEVIGKRLERRKVEHLPDITLFGGYMLRPDLPDMVSVGISASVPVRYESREKLLVLEERENLNSKRAELENLKISLRGEFEALRGIYRTGVRMLEDINRQIEEKRKELEAQLLALEYEREDIREILRTYKALWSLELMREKLITELNQTVARAEALQ
jgi:outer membrane protein TolC